MRRRDFLAYGGASAAALAAARPLEAMAQACGTCGTPAFQPTRRFVLGIEHLSVTMIDGLPLDHFAYALRAASDGRPAASARVPGPVLRVREGDLVEIEIVNDRYESHGFAIAGIPEATTEVDPGCSCTVSFTAPTAGTYVYHDPVGGTPLYRLLGLHGVLVVEPAHGLTLAGSPTPYSLDALDARTRASVSALFDALGETERFQGGAEGKWKAAETTAECGLQEKIWLANAVDPRLNALIQPNRAIRSDRSLTRDIVSIFTPRYFTLNGRSGYDVHADKPGDLEAIVANYIGEPTLIRTANVGLCHHFLHIHGNHVMDLARTDLNPTSDRYGGVVVAGNILEVDTWQLWPMGRRDVLLPLEIPPDIPFMIPLGATRPSSQFERMVEGSAHEPFPLRYVMHCHAEISQTAAGGNYPQGLVTHWELLGGVGGRAKALRTASR